MKKEAYKSPLEILTSAAQVIYDKKGSNILALDVKGISSITDYILIAEGNVDRHVSSMARAIMETLEEKPVHVEGLSTGDWVVLDLAGVMIHLFSPGLRERYSLEKLWTESKIVDLEIALDR